jgi:D-alanine-D-alanine ligase-like ATP-grasp enzyme
MNPGKTMAARPMPRPQLILIYEPEAACRKTLHDQGYAERHALEISSYLAQSTDIALEFSAIADACAARGLDFAPTALDDAPAILGKADPATTLVWTITDGIAYFRGGACPALARLAGLRTIGADDSLFALCQDKFRSGAVMDALGLPVPKSGLARDGVWLMPPPVSPTGYFVKPNRLGAKIGIWPDSRCNTLDEALVLSRRVFAAYRDDVVVQPYVAGRNARASYLAVDPAAGIDAIGTCFVESGADFQTMDDSLALYGETGAQAKEVGLYTEPALMPVAVSQPEAARQIGEIAARLMLALDLRDVFSLDVRIEADDTVHLIEFEVCPGLPCFDFRDYCRTRWGLSLPDAIAETARARLLP